MPLFLVQAHVVITSGASRLLHHSHSEAQTHYDDSQRSKSWPFSLHPKPLMCTHTALRRNAWDLSYIRPAAISVSFSVLTDLKLYVLCQFGETSWRNEEMSTERPLPNTFSMTWTTLLHSLLCYRLIFPSSFAHTRIFCIYKSVFHIFLLLSSTFFMFSSPFAPLFLFSIPCILTLCPRLLSSLQNNFYIIQFSLMSTLIQVLLHQRSHIFIVICLEQDVCNCTFKKSIWK